MTAAPPFRPQDCLQVLLVEDNAGDAELIRIALSKAVQLRFEITRAISLDDAMRFAKEVRFDVMLLDLSLPDSYGMQTAASALAACPGLPVVILTGIDDEDLEMSVLRSGAQDFVSKNEMTRGSLVRVIRHAIERVKAEEERERLEKRLLAAQKFESLGRISSGIAHDFNNLLVTILGNTELALLDMPSDSPLRSYLEEVETAGQSAAGLTRQLGAYAGQTSYDFEVIHVSRLISDMSRPLRCTIDQNPTLAYEPGGQLEGAAWIAADIHQMRQAILNVIANAAESLDETGGIITIRTAIERMTRSTLRSEYLISDLPEGDYVCIEIQDNGSGINTESMQRIFDPFFSTKFAGRGLGLTAALGIIRGHRGTIRITSDSKSGTIVQILLPCVSAVRPPAGSPEVSQYQLDFVDDQNDSPGSKQDRNRKTILILDSQRDTRKLVTAMLARAGYETHTATTAQRAIECLTDNRQAFCAAVLGSGFSERGQRGTFWRLRGICPRLPVVFCSEDDDAGDGSYLSGLDFVAVAHKPFRLAELAKKIRHAQQERLAISAHSSLAAR